MSPHGRTRLPFDPFTLSVSGTLDHGRPALSRTGRGGVADHTDSSGEARAVTPWSPRRLDPHGHLERGRRHSYGKLPSNEQINTHKIKLKVGGPKKYMEFSKTCSCLSFDPKGS